MYIPAHDAKPSTFLPNAIEMMSLPHVVIAKGTRAEGTLVGAATGIGVGGSVGAVDVHPQMNKSAATPTATTIGLSERILIPSVRSGMHVNEDSSSCK
jgi:hypothetical protein